jgi:hypothetical protein
MTQPSVQRLERLLDGVERILSEMGWDGEAPYAFFGGEEDGVSSLGLPATGSDDQAEALAAVVMHHMLQIGADQCAVVMPAPQEPGVHYLDGHLISEDGIQSIRRKLCLGNTVCGYGAQRMPAQQH